MDVNCSGYTGLQPGAAAHFFARIQAAPGITRIIVRVSGLRGAAAPGESGFGSGFGLRDPG